MREGAKALLFFTAWLTVVIYALTTI